MKRVVFTLLFLPTLLMAGPFREGSRGGVEVTPVPVEVSPEVFTHRVELKGEVKVPAPALVTLPEEVITQAQAGYTDLRVFDDQGQVVPHVIYDQLVPERESSVFEFEPRDVVVEGDVTRFILYRKEAKGPYDQMDIRTQEQDFKKKVSIYSSPDGKQWTRVGEDLIYDYTSRLDLSKRRVKFKAIDTPWLRLDLADDVSAPAGQGEIALEFLIFRVVARPWLMRTEGFRGICTDGRDEFKRYGEHTLNVAPHKQGKVTVLDLGRLNSPVEEVRLDISTPFFLRKVEWWGAETLKPVAEDPEEGYRWLGSADIYRVPGDDRVTSSVFPRLSHASHLRLKIIDEDNPPLVVAGAKMVWIRQNLYFIAAPGRQYQLYFGNTHVKAPVYEMARLLRLDPAELLVLPEFVTGVVEQNASFDAIKAVPNDSLKQKKRDEQLILQGVILILVAALGVWVFRLLRRLPPPPSGV